MIVTFDFEGCDESAAFFALYAGLRMYKEQREKRTPQGQFSIAAAEAAGMMEDLKEKFPKEYAECEEEYSIAYPVSQFPSPQEVTETALREAFEAAKKGSVKRIPVVIDQYGGTNIEEHFIADYPTFEDYLRSKLTNNQNL